MIPDLSLKSILDLSPEIIDSSIVEQTDTTAILHLETNEPLSRVIVRYRIIGAELWEEFEIIPAELAFDIELSGLTAGEFYEYQCVIADKSNNETITEWQQI